MKNQSSNTPRSSERKPLAARRTILMASVVTGLVLGGYALHHAGFGLAAAHAQVGSAVGRGAQPAGFSDLVEKAKPSVISVKVKLGDGPDALEHSGRAPKSDAAQSASSRCAAS